MVTKGVLKDHLVLLANSMTYSGNLIGFNMGGIKALSRSLNVQVPFTEATLFVSNPLLYFFEVALLFLGVVFLITILHLTTPQAPRKCFERAAEKCHVDNLSSVVASCAWGKQVAVGSGSAFDILLDTRKVYFTLLAPVDCCLFPHFGGGGVEESFCDRL